MVKMHVTISQSPRRRLLNCWTCSTNNPKSKDIQFTVIQNGENPLIREDLNNYLIKNVAD